MKTCSSKKYQFCIGIPVYNTDLELLQKCIESVLNQKYKFFSVVIIDDFSTNGAFEFLTSITDTRVLLFRNENNEGATKTRSKILSRATGDYFLWVDSDDWIEPDYLEKCNEEINKRCCDEEMLFICNANLYQSNKLKGKLYKSSGAIIIERKVAIELLMCDRKIKSYPWTFIIPVNILNKIDFSKAATLKTTIVDDLAISIQYAIQSKVACFLKSVCGYNHNFGVLNSESNTGILEKRLIETYSFLLAQYESVVSKNAINITQWNILLNKALCEMMRSDNFKGWCKNVNTKYGDEISKANIHISYIKLCGIKFYILFFLLKWKITRQMCLKIIWKKRD